MKINIILGNKCGSNVFFHDIMSEGITRIEM